MSRTPFVPAELLSKLWRAVIEFDMLQAGDKILIGLSGGKDSMFLTAALAEIQKYAPVPLPTVRHWSLVLTKWPWPTTTMMP